MLPDYELSIYPIKSLIIGGKGLPHSLKVDYETGPVGIQDPSEGINYQIWSGIVNPTEGIYLWADNTPIAKYLSLADISEFNFTFDQNANLAIVYVRYGIAYLYWYDSTISDMTTTTLGSNYISPKLSLDDKRSESSATSDIVLGYIRNNNLCIRLQRDRYETEYVLELDVRGRIDSMGMGKNWRFQFHLIAE